MSIRFDWSLRAARVRRLAPPQVPAFVSTLLLFALLGRVAAVSLNLPDDPPVTSRAHHCVAHLYCLFAAFLLLSIRVLLDPFAVFRQLSHFLNDLRVKHQSLRALVAMPLLAPSDCSQSPWSEGHPVTVSSCLWSVDSETPCRRATKLVRTVRHLYRYGDSQMTPP